MGSVTMSDVGSLFATNVVEKMLVLKRFIAEPEILLREDKAPVNFVTLDSLSIVYFEVPTLQAQVPCTTEHLH